MNKQIIEVIDAVINGFLFEKDGKRLPIIKARKFMQKNLVIRATRTRYNGKFNPYQMEMTLSICKPNFEEREWLKNTQGKETKYPIKGISMVKLYNPTKKKLSGKVTKK